MKTIVFASHNKHKCQEVADLLAQCATILDLSAIGFLNDIPEIGNTFHENALIKAKTVFDSTGFISLSDDSGLEVDALNGKPGVWSARFAGQSATDSENIQLLLDNLSNVENRNARFVTVLCLYNGIQPYFFEGSVDGVIATVPQGNQGFGYDPVFIPNGFSKTFAQLSPNQKNQISHRFNAVLLLKDFLKTYQ